MLKEQRAEAAAIGRRVFIKGLAATGALVGGLAVSPPASAQEGRAGSALAAGRRPTPFSQGWTSQPGRFLDDVSLPGPAATATGCCGSTTSTRMRSSSTAIPTPPPRRPRRSSSSTLATVKSHVGHILGKLQVSNRTQAVARARELGLLP